MKKLNKGIKLVVLLIVFLYSGRVFAVDTVESTDTCSIDYAGNQEAIDNCKKQVNICKSKLANKFSWNQEVESVTNSVITQQIKNDFDDTVRQFDVEIKYTSSKGVIATEKRTVNTNETFYIDTKYDGSDMIIISLVATIVSDASVKDGDNTYNCNGKFVLEANYRFDDNSRDMVENTSRTGICARYKSGTLNEDDKKLVGEQKYIQLNKGGVYSWEKVVSANAVANFDQLIPYCNYEYVYDLYSDEMVLSQIYQASQIAINKSRFSQQSLPNSQANGFKKIDKPSDGISLVCDAFSSSSSCDITGANVRKFYSTTSSKESMSFEYTPNTSTKKDVCELECVEELTISYAPPVAVKAGMCFEYEVKVESKVTCNSKIITEAPKMSDYAICSPTSHCNNHGTYYFDQGGPNEEFDACVNEIDGGKYKQSTIDKCYNKVYGKKSNEMDYELLDYSVVRLASLPAWCNSVINSERNPDQAKCIAARASYNYADINKYCPRNRTANEEYLASQPYTQYSSGGYQGGYYYYSGSKINWQPYDANYNDNKLKLADNTIIKAVPGCYWNGYARYYFFNKRKGIRTVLNDEHNQIWYEDGEDRLGYWKYYPDNGFKRGRHCNENCTWSASCSDGYLNTYAPVDDGGNSSKNNKNSAYNAWYLDLKEYNEKLASCSAKAICDTKTATYKMTVNNASGKSNICALGKDSGECTSWSNTNKNNSCSYNAKITDTKKESLSKAQINRKDLNGNMCTPVVTTPVTNIETLTGKGCSKLDKNSIIKEVSGVCANIPGDYDDYRSVISFPGTWIRNKGGKRTYAMPDNESYYQFVPGQYCLPLTVHEVNTDWWNWDQVYNRAVDKASLVNYTKATDITGTNYSKYNGDMNILSKIVDFGYLHWNLDVSCFYSVKNNDTCDGNNCSSGDKDKDGTNGEINIETRAAALDQLFPTSDSTSPTGVSASELDVIPSKLGYSSSDENLVKNMADTDTSNTTRQPGYNWSCDATNLLIKDYPITPTALTSKIQSKGDSIYNDSSEVDYKVVLTTTNIKNIRSYNKNRKYNDYGLELYKNDSNSINFYKSTFLNNSDHTYVSSITSPSKHTCNNTKNNGTECDNLLEFVQAESMCSKLISEKSLLLGN